MSTINDDYYSGAERRLAKQPRRSKYVRRHRTRTESLVCDCRNPVSRRKEDEEGFIEISSLYSGEEISANQPHTPK